MHRPPAFMVPRGAMDCIILSKRGAKVKSKMKGTFLAHATGNKPYDVLDQRYANCS